MKRNPQTPTSEGVFIAVIFNTVVSNIPNITKLKATNDSLKDFVVENREQIAKAIIQTYQAENSVNDSVNEKKTTAITGLVVGTIRETTNNFWIAKFGLDTLLECFE